MVGLLALLRIGIIVTGIRRQAMDPSSTGRQPLLVESRTIGAPSDI